MSKVKINAGESNIITPIRITSNYNIKILYFYKNVSNLCYKVITAKGYKIYQSHSCSWWKI